MILNVKFSESKQDFDSDFGEVHNISDGGFERGYAEGHNVGYEKGNTEGYTKGHTEGYENGYSNGHTEGYSEGEIKGKEQGYTEGYDVGAFPFTQLRLTTSNFSEAEFPQGYDLVLNVNKVLNISNTFRKCTGVKSIKIVAEVAPTTSVTASFGFRETTAEIIDISEWKVKLNEVQYLFYMAKNLKSIIGAMDFSECTGVTTSWLDQCASLEDIEFVPNTIKVSLSFSGWRSCTKLTKASITSAINGLNDSVTGKTVSFTLDAVNKAFETSEGANDGSTSAEWLALIATKPNWTISLQ